MRYSARLSESLPRVRDAISSAAQAVGRDAADVRIVCVTKGHPLSAVNAAVEAGLTDLGENRVEELEQKVASLGDTGVRWHMIGHLQSRKAGRAVAVADLVHSIDTGRLAAKVSRAAVEANRKVDVLFQINTSGEEAKYGFDAATALDSVLEACELPGLEARGLMAMAPFTSDEGTLRRTFGELRRLGGQLRRHRPDFGGELSMGMTNDLRIAVEEGSTMVRVGTALLGERPLAGGAPETL